MNKNTITHEKYLVQLKAKDIEVYPLESYIKNTVKILHKCICGNEWFVTPKKVKLGQFCGCGGDINKKYLIKLKNKNIKVIPLEEYKGSKVKILHKCICGNEWEISPNSVLNNSTCGCSRRFSDKQYIKLLTDKNINVVPLEKYYAMDTKIKHKCICGNIWDIEPSEILKGRTCGCNKKYSHTKYLELLKKKNIKVLPLEEYNGSEKNIKHKCICGNIWTVSPSNVLVGQHCGCKKIGHNIETYRNKKTILYYIKVDNMWKIGLSIFTRKTIEENILKKRFGKDIKNGVKIKILKTEIFEDGAQAFLKEQKLLEKNKNIRYKGKKLLYSGNTEILLENIL